MISKIFYAFCFYADFVEMKVFAVMLSEIRHFEESAPWVRLFPTKKEQPALSDELFFFGGRKRTRTADLLRVKQAL